MGFAEGSVEGEKVFGGREFPRTLLPPSTVEAPGPGDLVELVKRERGWLADALQHHRAILFRGFGLALAKDFARVVEAFGWDEFGYDDLADRSKVTDRIYTASEAPLDVFIPFHHEMTLVFFFYLQSSPKGGQASIVRSDVIMEKMEERMPPVVERLQREGMRFVIHTKTTHKRDTNKDSARGLVWQWMLKTKDKVEGEKRVLETLACSSVVFNDDGTADFHYGPMNPTREFEGKRVWFNMILGYTSEERNASANFVDGSPLPSEAANAYPWRKIVLM